MNRNYICRGHNNRVKLWEYKQQSGIKDFYECVSSLKSVGLSHVNKLQCHPHRVEGPGVLGVLGLRTRYVDIWYESLNTE